MKLKWQSKPPRKEGWWFVSQFKRSNSKRKRFSNVCEVRQSYGEWEWSFIDGMTWQSTDVYPAYEWAGPLIPPP